MPLLKKESSLFKDNIMRKTENFNGLAFFNNDLKFDIKMLLTSDMARLTLMVTLMAIGLYALQFINIAG